MGDTSPDKGNNGWSQYHAKAKASPEVKEAMDVVDATSTIVPKKPGPNGNSVFGIKNRKPFEGIQKKTSDILRHVVGLKYQRYTLREAFESAAQKYEIKPESVEKYWYNNASAIEEAEKEHLALVLEKYHTNLLIVNDLLGEAAPEAVETLRKTMRAKKASPNVKAGAATSILKLAGIGQSHNAGGNTIKHGGDKVESEATEVLKLVKDITAIKEGKSHLLDIEDAEVVKEDDSAD